MKIKSLILTGLFSLVASMSAHAATLYVDGVNGSDTNNSCMIATNACKTPWHAYTQSAAGDEILIVKGTYNQPTDGCQQWFKWPVSLKGGYDASFNPLTRSGNPEDTIFKVAHATAPNNANNAMCRFLVITTGTSGWLTLDSLTIEGAGQEGSDSHSGTLLFFTNPTGTPPVSEVSASWLRLNNVVMRDNNMKAGGGAIAIGDGTDNKLEIINSRFENNTASNSGGAIAINAAATVTIKGSSFKHNQAKGDSVSNTGGAAIFINHPQVAMHIEDSVFDNNGGNDLPNDQYSKHGAAITVLGNPETRTNTITIDRSSFTNNIAQNNGGAIYAEQGIWKITNSTFSNNTSTNGSGGGIGNNRALMTLRYVTIVGNQSGAKGGGLGVWDNDKGEAEIEASIITGNTSTALGADDIWLFNNSSITDKGYNLIGSNNNAYMTDKDGNVINYRAWFTDKDGSNNYTTQVISGATESVLVPTAEYNGGSNGVFTNKLTKNSVARDAIPNTGGLFYGVGKSQSYPFTDLKQVNAFFNRDGYGARSYFFDLGGSYNEDLAFTSGIDSSLVFPAKVDSEGYIELGTSIWNALNDKTGFVAVDGTEPNTKLVRYTAGLCDGSVATDGRGLPRSDRVKGEAPVNNCDIGAFEFNNYYKIDCYEEDGERFDNTFNEAQFTWCGNPLNSTPRDLIENLGAFNWYWSLTLLGLLAVRLRKPA